MTASTKPEGLDFIAGDSEMARRIREFDWSLTSLGAPATWPQALRTMVHMAMMTRHPVFIFWGPEHLCLYNDAYSASIGAEKHPSILGKSGLSAWQEIWHIIGPQIELVMRGDGATWHENQLVPIIRHGELQDVYWTYSYAPIHDDSAQNGVGGVLVLCTETTELVLARRRLADERQRLNELFERAPIFMALLQGPTHVIELANPAYLSLVQRSDVIGKPVAEALPEAASQGYLAILDDVYRTGNPYLGTTSEYRGSTPTAPARYLDFVYQPIAEEDGNIGGIFVVGTDVTDRVVALRSLERNEELLRLATDAADIGFWDVDLVRDTLFWPDRVKAMFGIAPGAAVSLEDFYGGLHPQDKASVAAAFAAAVDPAERALYDVEYRTVGRDDGVTRWLAARGRGIFDDGRCVRVVGSVLDITKRKHDEQRLQALHETLERRLQEYLAEKKLLADIVDGTDAFVQVADANFNWLAINRASANEFERIFGRRPAVGLNMLTLLEDMPAHRDAVRQVWQRALSGEDFVEVSEFGDEALDRRSYEMRFRPLRDEQGNLIGAYQFVYDVTERLVSERRLAEAEAALHQAQKMEAVGQLTGGIAHDFNNLLQALGSSFELLRRKPNDLALVSKLAERGVGTVRKASRLTSQLLTFSRHQALDFRPVQLKSTVGGIEELLRTTVGSSVRLSIGQIDDADWVYADGTQLEMAILNLAINSRDAMPAGGELRLSVRSSNTSGCLDIVVEDTGLGMSSEVASRAFDPFFTTKELGKGSGLGLSQVYAMATKGGGTAKVSSTPGHGTSVILTLKRAEPVASPSPADLVSLAKESGILGLVLVVDDDVAVRQNLVAELQSLGHQVAEAGDGEAALQLIHEHPVDVVLLDFAMPGMNGAQVARLARDAKPNLGIVFMSGYSDTEAISAAVGQGAVLLRKPFDLRTLHERIQSSLRHRLS